MVKTREMVETAHLAALQLGSEQIHGPQHFHQYPQPHYAVFWLDPMGIMIEAVCHHDR